MIASDIGTNEAFAVRETNPLTNSKDIIDAPKWPGQINGRASK